MKLTKEHIGKKVSRYAWYNVIDRETWIELVAIRGDAIIGFNENGKSYGHDHANDDDWSFYEKPKPLTKYEQIFKKFGCNEEHVKELVTEMFKDIGERTNSDEGLPKKLGNN